MGSIAKKFVSPAMTLIQLISIGHLALPLSVAAQSSSEAVTRYRELKQTAAIVKPRLSQAEQGQHEAKLPVRTAGEFETLLAKAKAQRAIMDQWRKAHSTRPDWESLDR